MPRALLDEGERVKGEWESCGGEEGLGWGSRGAVNVATITETWHRARAQPAGGTGRSGGGLFWMHRTSREPGGKACKGELMPMLSRAARGRANVATRLHERKPRAASCLMADIHGLVGPVSIQMGFVRNGVTRSRCSSNGSWPGWEAVGG